MSRLFDTHCHLVDLSEDLKDQLTSHNTIQFLSVGTNPNDWQNTLKISDLYSSVHSAVGLHPWFVADNYLNDLSLLATILANASEIKAVGEIGLDFNKKYQAYYNEQLIAFEYQLKLANQLERPVSVHCYKAYNQALQLFKTIPSQGIMHGFMGCLELAKQFVKQGLYIGVNGIILNSNARRYHQMIKGIGLANLVLETDAPYGANLPSLFPFDVLPKIATQVATLLACSVEEVIDQTGYNASMILLKDS